MCRAILKPILVASVVLLAASFLTPNPVQAQQRLTSQDVEFEQGELLIGGKTVRLYGIHFPTQPGICSKDLNGCRDLGLEALTEWLAGGGPVECEVLGVTRSETHVARCQRDEIDLGAWLIGHGYALADRRAGRVYLRDQQAARSENAGLWRGDWAMTGDR
jgi:endonuclease YncB( thermonuclease family)